MKVVIHKNPNGDTRTAPKGITFKQFQEANACRMCNFYKSTYTIEKFRENIQTLNERLEKNFIYRLAKKFGIVEENTDPIKFYFEKNQ